MHATPAYLRHPDRYLRLVLVSATLFSAVLSGVMGYALAYGSGSFARIACAGLFCLFSITLGLAVTRAARHHESHRERAYRSMWTLCCVLAVMNVIVDFGAATVLREVGSTKTEHQNTKVAHVSEKRSRLLAEKERLERVVEKGLRFPDSSAFEEQIETARFAVELEASRGGCKDKCLARKRELAALVENKGVALRREEAEDRLDAIALELANTEGAFGQMGVQQTDVGLAQIRNWVRIGTGSLSPTGEALQWGQLLFMAGVSMALTYLIVQLGWETGRREGEIEEYVVPKELGASPEAKQAAQKLAAITLPSQQLADTNIHVYGDTTTISDEAKEAWKRHRALIEEALG